MRDLGIQDAVVEGLAHAVAKLAAVKG